MQHNFIYCYYTLIIFLVLVSFNNKESWITTNSYKFHLLFIPYISIIFICSTVVMLCRTEEPNNQAHSSTVDYFYFKYIFFHSVNKYKLPWRQILYIAFFLNFFVNFENIKSARDMYIF